MTRRIVPSGDRSVNTGNSAGDFLERELHHPQVDDIAILEPGGLSADEPLAVDEGAIQSADLFGERIDSPFEGQPRVMARYGAVEIELRQINLGLQAGHRLILETPGGGGWGLPFQRSIMRVEEDLVRGNISGEQSKSRYGVVLKPGSLEKDDHLTYRVRHYLLSTLAAEDIIAGEELLD